MCGIVGALSSRPIDRSVVERMRDRLVHRGPDDAALWASEDTRVALAHTRLVIIDPSPEANQPFVSGDLVLTFNGEIYNWRDLRDELADEGVHFRTRSDTEVLVEAYRRWGDRCVERLSGMFAFALWDGSSRRLFCARDRAGEKPFYYAEIDGAFVFASELKSLLLWPGFERTLDHAALADFFAYGFVPDPKSIWAGAAKLPPGHSLAVSLPPGSRPIVAQPNRYWDFAPLADEGIRDWGDEIRSTLEAAASEMAYADVPVGTFLSGGVDSSSVTAALARAGRSVDAYTIGFADEAFDERPYARQVASLYARSHSERVVDPSDVESVFRDTIRWHYDEPFNDYSYLPTYYVCRAAREQITVALSGDGGDELFGGYGKYRRLAVRQAVDGVVSPRPARRMLAGAGAAVPAGSPWRTRLETYAKSPPEMLADMLTTGLAGNELRRVARGGLASALDAYDPRDVVREQLVHAPPREVGLVNSMRYLDLKLTLAGGILVKVDRASMAVALEVRPVYLHRDVLALAARIPPGLLADRRNTKTVLKAALRPWLPASVLDRPKMGFAMPLGRWLRGDLKQLVESVQRPDSRISEMIDPAFVRDAVAAHVNGRNAFPSLLHSLIFLEGWLETWA